MPPSKEPCDIPNCDGTARTDSTPRLDGRRHVNPYDRVDAFHETKPKVTLANNVSAIEVHPKHESKYTHSAAGGWLYTEWSQVKHFLIKKNLVLLLNQRTIFSQRLLADL